MILDQIAAKTRLRIEEEKKIHSPQELREQAFALAALQKRERPLMEFPFETALAKKGLSFICEVKKASPSKAVIAESFDYIQIAKDYERAGADAISILTEPYWFQGADNYLKEITDTVQIPAIRKDFTVDSYMIYQAKLLGASSVLLICSILDTMQIAEYLELCDALSLSAIVEAHDEQEVKAALSVGAKIIGVNNRNLKTFDVDINNCMRLRDMVKDKAIFVAESGIKDSFDIKMLNNAGVDAVLIGETLMRATDKSAALKELKKEI